MVEESVEYDVVVIGAGPNGLSAAILLQKAGLKILLIEGQGTIGGNMRSAALTLPGFIHDIGAAIHPMAAGSPFLSGLPLQNFGLEYIYPPYSVAHPFDDGTAAVLESSICKTASGLDMDEKNYFKLFTKMVNEWPMIASDVLGPLRIPHHPLAMLNFGTKALLSAEKFSEKYFSGERARGLFAGMAAHSTLPFSKIASAAAGLTLMIQGHRKGWPVIKGGTQQLANAMGSYFISLGGQIQTSFKVGKLGDIPRARAVILDMSPKQALGFAGDQFSSSYQSQMKRYRYGMGVFKIDWALDSPIPFTSDSCRKAGTVHMGNSFDEIAASEQNTADGIHPEKPFVLVAQQSVFDSTRAPRGKHTAWAYCHVPFGSSQDMRSAIENQVERFAPGFRQSILSAHTMNTKDMELFNPNNIGGSIDGGVQDIQQLFTRPVRKFSPYRTSAKAIYLCSSSTPPGGGVHGMCGYQAAKKLLKDIFKTDVGKLSD